jgi:hydroxymethylpyrimidine/phosphomethylpyrimidine kinase
VTIKTCLAIAGWDGSGGAGIQADLKTFSALGCYGTTVLTALPVQNTCGVRACYDIPLASIGEQLSALFDDMRPDAIKIGMLFSTAVVEVVAAFLKKNATSIPIVLDPVMIAQSGDMLLKSDAVQAIKQLLIPLATIVTPNVPEAMALVQADPSCTWDPCEIGKQCLQLGAKAVLLKGGHATSTGVRCNDLLLRHHHDDVWLDGARITTKHTHGTGCTLSSAICAGLARGVPLLDACRIAKRYVWNAINAAKEGLAGKGAGPIQHFYHVWQIFENML